MTSPASTPLALNRLDGPAPELTIVVDLVRRSLPVVPAVILVGLLGWGIDGAASAGYGLAIVLANLIAAALIIAGAARISLAFLMAATLFGYVLRLGLVFLAVLAVRNAGWVDLWPLGLTIIVTHLGLLAWETRYVSASLAYPALAPKRPAAREQDLST